MGCGAEIVPCRFLGDLEFSARGAQVTMALQKSKSWFFGGGARATTKDYERRKKAEQERLVMNMINTWNHVCSNDFIHSHIRSDASHLFPALLRLAPDGGLPLPGHRARAQRPNISSSIGFVLPSLLPDIRACTTLAAAPQIVIRLLVLILQLVLQLV
jgi:hypothetical protein